MAADEELFLGFDLSTQRLKCIAINAQLAVKHQAKVDFDADLRKYGTHKGVLTNPIQHEVYASPLMWLEAIDLVLERLQADGIDFRAVRGISGAGMQHGTVFWSEDAEQMLNTLDPRYHLVDQLGPSASQPGKSAFAYEYSPNWQDASTQKQCNHFNALSNSMILAQTTGSSAHHRFSGPQILKYQETRPESYEKTARICLVSSFLASVLLGKIAPIDISDVTGMNLWDLQNQSWHEDLLSLAAGGETAQQALRDKLGEVQVDSSQPLGRIASYFVDKYGFSPEAQICSFTGDNPATILSLPLRPDDAIVSLGTSTTFLTSTSEYKPDPAYHFMNHPTTAGLYMFMLCYKNGSLAREQVRDECNKIFGSEPGSWDAFDSAALSTEPLAQDREDLRLGLYFPKPEIVPNAPAGQWHFSYDPISGQLEQTTKKTSFDARCIVESQMLSLRLRSQRLLSSGSGAAARPRRIYLVGGGSANHAIAQICGEVLGPTEGVYRLETGGNACALGAAHKALWTCRRKQEESFEDFIAARWHESDFLVRVADGSNDELYNLYGQAIKGLALAEEAVIAGTKDNRWPQDLEHT